MWYIHTTLALELKIEWLYKRDDKVWNMFCGGLGDNDYRNIHPYTITKLILKTA